MPSSRVALTSPKWRNEFNISPSETEVQENHTVFRRKSSTSVAPASPKRRNGSIVSPTQKEFQEKYAAASQSSRKDSSGSSTIGEKEGIANESNPVDGSGKKATWWSLPRKTQLFIIAFSRLAEPITQTSINSYIFFMLRSFDPSLSDSAISTQAGIMGASFTGAQCLTAVIWGHMADKASVGRKNVIIIGLLGTLVGTIGFGFSRSFGTALFFRLLGGSLNGNVSILRTMTSENVKEKRYQTKAFLLSPIMFNFGALLGPLLGGWLQDPVNTFPHTFGPGSKLGGIYGVGWMLKYPYALPNLMNGLLLLIAVLLVIFGLRETHRDRQRFLDPGLKLRELITHNICGTKRQSKYNRLEAEEDTNSIELRSSSESSANPEPGLPSPQQPRIHQQLPPRRLFRRNVVLTFITHGLMAGHISSFQTLWFLFLSTPRYDPVNPDPAGYTPRLPIFFTGGLGLSPKMIGAAIGLNGGIGLLLQFGVYSWITSKFGLVYTLRYSLVVFPLLYAIAPYLSLLPTTSEAPHAADGAWIWIGICSLLIIIVSARTFSQPSSLLLINNCTPHPSVLSTVHAIAQSVSAGSRTLGPLFFSSLYGQGLRKGMVGMAWWTLMVQALVAFGASWMLYEGNGHEILLEGDDDDD